MLEALGGGIALFFDPTVLLLVALAVPIGLVMGVLPGLSGLSALALLLPFVYGLQPMSGLAFLLAAHAVVSTGGRSPPSSLEFPARRPMRRR